MWLIMHRMFLKLNLLTQVLLLAGKSSVLLDVKPWDDETDMKKLEEAVKSVKMEGLTWGACMFLFDFLVTEHLLYIRRG